MMMMMMMTTMMMMMLLCYIPLSCVKSSRTIGCIEVRRRTNVSDLLANWLCSGLERGDATGGLSWSLTST